MKFKLFIKTYSNDLILKGEDNLFYICTPPYNKCVPIEKEKYYDLVYSNYGYVYPYKPEFQKLSEIRNEILETAG